MSFLERIYWITGPPADAVSHSLGSFPIGVVFLVSSFLFSLEKETKKKQQQQKCVSVRVRPSTWRFRFKVKGPQPIQLANYQTRSCRRLFIIIIFIIIAPFSVSFASFLVFFVPRVRTRTRTASFFFIWATPPPQTSFFFLLSSGEKKR